MKQGSDALIRIAAVAGGGLLSRRRLLGGAMAAAGSASAINAGLAEPSAPEWATVAGVPARDYGVPAAHEKDVRRTLIQPYEKLAPGYSFSGTPLQHLRGTITPNGLHFEVHHGGRADIDPRVHRLMIHGLVKRPLKFDLDALDRYPMVTRTHFIECAGNSFFNALTDEPMQAGCDTLHGLVSNAEWTGIPLSILLSEADVDPRARWVVATGGDAASLSRSLPLRKVMADGMLALHQNGERLRPEQGYPMRILLPGFEGNMNIKWVTSLQLTDTPAYTKDESGQYTEMLADGSVLAFTFRMGVKSVITRPSATMTMSGPGLYQVSGLAWSGGGAIRAVEISADGGQSWATADLTTPVLSQALTRFTLPWHWDGSPALLMSRAIDEKGARQPTRTEWKSRYAPTSANHYNAIQSWRIDAAGSITNVYA